MSGDDYAALGRLTASALMSGQLDADGLAVICRNVLDLDYPAALAVVRRQTTTTEGNTTA
ncbi:hypothetical protein [Gordonia amicalis]|uniref:hypothetical protein n=1 Tax=Gordonia amicalis TaxID=89053 RepID=UPI000425C191|nr:hypothetical protein [Gordonia amicalis]